MIRKFINTTEFDNQWKAMGLNDSDLKKLQNEILENPKLGSVIKGTGKLRKMRFAFEGKGKSNSTRVIYVDFVVHSIIYLITAYPKNKKENLSNEERNNLKKLITHIEETLK